MTGRDHGTVTLSFSHSKVRRNDCLRRFHVRYLRHSSSCSGILSRMHIRRGRISPYSFLGKTSSALKTNFTADFAGDHVGIPALKIPLSL